MNKSKQMRWSRRGADLLLQVRCAVYNGMLGSGFGQRFHAANDPYPQAAVAACPPVSRQSLMSQGISSYDPLGKDRLARLDALETRDGHRLPPRLRAEIGRDIDRLELLTRQLKQVKTERDALVAPAPQTVGNPATLLMQLKGIGAETASLIWLEGLFRTFTNRRHLAAYAGLAPTPRLSGRIQREQGISKSGNPRLRTAMVELAWLWLRNQPGSALSRWFAGRVREERGRKRRVTIVALARKLLVSLWKYVSHGEVPEGAVLKPV